MNLILFEPGEISGGTRGTLSRHDERAVHLLKVLRKKEGDVFTAGVLGGKLGSGIIEEIHPSEIRFSLEPDTEPPPRTPLRLAAGFPRPIQLRRLLRDCAGLGLAAVDLLGTDLGEKSYRDTKLLNDGGARAAFVEGAVQARDTRLPELSMYAELDTWLGARPWENGHPALLAAADNVQPQKSFSELKVPAGTVSSVLAVGSERGWSGRERELLEKAGFVRLSIGSRALRTETACIAASVLLMDKTGLLLPSQDNSLFL